MMSRFLTRLIVIVLLVGLLPTSSGYAQADDTDEFEALALRVHLLNQRSGDFTTLPGIELGDPDSQVKPAWPYEKKLTGWDDLERPTLLNIWASWCGPCVQEFPHLTKIALAPDDHAYDVIFINSLETANDAKRFLADQPDGIQIKMDPDGVLLNTVGSVGIPTNILVQPDGTVLAIHVGSFTNAHAALFEFVALHPGEGSFDPADYADVEPTAEIAEFEANDALPIAFDEPIEGELSDDLFQQVYQFEGKAGDIVSAQVSRASDDLEPYVILLDENGERLAEPAEYYYYDPAVKLDGVILPEDGTYFLVVTRFLEADGLSHGSYTLKLTRG
ncbi:MAG TPA: TlpA disulfide reductase family protein [Aggregatilineaceae bacterium]|nr:TlpA disulfide reductase family protein [Aggregatilineaceae bacterium]